MPELQTCLREALGGRSGSVLGQRTAEDERSPAARRGRRRRALADSQVVGSCGRAPHLAGRTAVAARGRARGLRAAAAGRRGGSRAASGAWQVYDDLPGRPLSTEQPVEARGGGGDRGDRPRAHGLRRASHCCLNAGSGRRSWHGLLFGERPRRGSVALRSLDFDRHRPGAIAARDALLARMGDLAQEESERAEVLAAAGGPETLLHGDLWPTNAIVLSNGDGVRVRLIDWDEAAAGPSWFDVSTFLLRFDPSHRPWILDAYRRAVDRLADWEHSRRPRSEPDLRDLRLRSAREPARVERRRRGRRRLGLAAGATDRDGRVARRGRGPSCRTR